MKTLQEYGLHQDMVLTHFARIVNETYRDDKIYSFFDPSVGPRGVQKVVIARGSYEVYITIRPELPDVEISSFEYANEVLNEIRDCHTYRPSEFLVI